MADNNTPNPTDFIIYTADDGTVKAAQEYDKFRQVQDQTYISDFDQTVRQLTGKSDDGPAV